MPYYHFKMNVPITPQRVIEQLEKVTLDNNLSKYERYSSMGSGSVMLPIVPMQKKLFIGHIEKNNFDINRIINYRNSFLPFIRGKIISTAQGSEVSIQMSMHLLIVILISFWIIGSVCSALAYYYSNLDFKMSMEVIFPALFPLLGLLLVLLGFVPEVIIAKRLLSKAMMVDE